jgi:ATP-dependent DNA helicase RecQ
MPYRPGMTASHAQELLHAIAGPHAEFRDGQLESILALAERRERLLLVQRTGWGKSAVYFIATRLLRDQGAGATLLVSPLLALMRNQVFMAQQAGVQAATINSSNREDWHDILEDLRHDRIDLLLVSPERLNNLEFRRDVLPQVASHSGLLVIDEAHCVSDWGHDFRPDYRRVARVAELLAPGVPVLATTATANDRVIADITDQLDLDLAVQRGSLDRESLHLYTAHLPDPATRMAWLATYVPRLPGSGIVYCLTVADTERVAAWLREQGIDAEAYSGGVDGDRREDIEERLLAGRVKVVVATSALGMGFDKPDLGFVVHYQAPGSVVAYYQQVGRAGRALDKAFGVLLAGHEDADIQDYFIRTAFPPREQAEQAVAFLDAADVPLSLAKIQARVNARKTRLEGMLKVLEVEGAVQRERGGWSRTARPWAYDEERARRVTAQRRREQAAMTKYAESDHCLMQYLRAQLDDPSAERCRRCGPCTGTALPTDVPRPLVAAAVEFLRWQTLSFSCRRQWPYGLAGASARIPVDYRAEDGRALSVFGDAGWGTLVRDGKFVDERFSDELVHALAELVRERWRPNPSPTWVTCVPSWRRAQLVPDVALRLARDLGLPFRAVVTKVKDTRPQKELENSFQQAANVHDAFTITGRVAPEAVLLVDDIVDSRWTLTVVAALLREAGSGAVHPVALADAQPQRS